MRLLRFLAGLAFAALLHFVASRIWPGFPRAVDLFLLAAMLEARHGRPVAGMFAGLASGLLADGLSGGPYGLHGFANTAVGYGTARAAQQLVVQRTTGLAALFAAGAAAQQAILALLALVFRDRVELPDPLWLPIQVGASALLGLLWTHAAAALARRFRFWQRSRSSKLQLPG
jgi:rod shape-determining protein MreD